MCPTHTVLHYIAIWLIKGGYLSEHRAGLGGGVAGGVGVQGVVLQIWVPDDPTGPLWSWKNHKHTKVNSLFTLFIHEQCVNCS